ncbi:MAG: G/U mismatch-specific DNA glycosylase [Pyrinomonadaceae bacterium]
MKRTNSVGKAQRAPVKPTKEELRAAANKIVPDVIAPNLRVLFCGINPGLYTAATGFHFARPGNRFWPALYASGFTKRLLAPFEEHELLESGYGITNVVGRATATAAELSATEILEGGRELERKVRRFKPAFLAVLGIGAYRTAFQRPHATLGKQDEMIGASIIWTLPNPSGLNAHYQPKDLARMFSELRSAVEMIEHKP